MKIWEHYLFNAYMKSDVHVVEDGDLAELVDNVAMNLLDEEVARRC